MIVIVSAPGGSARSPLAATEAGGGADMSGFGPAPAAASAGFGPRNALTITIGSPPNGSSTNRIHPASTATHRPSAPATTREKSPGGSTKRFFFFLGVTPSGVFRSSVDTAFSVAAPQDRRSARTSA